MRLHIEIDMNDDYWNEPDTVDEPDGLAIGAVLAHLGKMFEENGGRSMHRYEFGSPERPQRKVGQIRITGMRRLKKEN